MLVCDYEFAILRLVLVSTGLNLKMKRLKICLGLDVGIRTHLVLMIRIVISINIQVSWLYFLGSVNYRYIPFRQVINYCLACPPLDIFTTLPICQTDLLAACLTQYITMHGWSQTVTLAVTVQNVGRSYHPRARPALPFLHLKLWEGCATSKSWEGPSLTSLYIILIGVEL